MRSSGEESWEKYIKFSGLNQIEDFCSLDANLNDSVFTPKSDEDWKNCVYEDNKIDMITNIEFAKKISKDHIGSKIFGLILDPINSSTTENTNLLGFDILDEYYSNSLLTNCDGFPDIFDNQIINRFGLLNDIEKAYEIRDKLRKEYEDDSHAGACEVIAIYDFRNSETEEPRAKTGK